MTRSVVVADHRAWTINALEPRAREELFQAVVVVQLVDDATGAPLAGPIRISGDLEGLRARVAGSGFAGLVGIPTRVLPLLDANAHTLDVTIAAEGYETRHVTVSFPAQAGFTNAELGALRMRRVPSVLTVSTYDLDTANRTQALGLVPARISGWWPTVARLGLAPTTTPLVGVGPGLSVPRTTGAALDLPALGTPAEPARILLQGVPPGATRIEVSNTGSLVVGDLVGLDLGDPERAERVEVTAVDGPADTLSPATVTVRFPFRTGHAATGAVVRLVPPGPAAPVATTTAAALEGDRTLRVSALVGLTAGQVARITGGGAPAEYRTLARYELTTSSVGVGRFPPLSGVAAVVVAATSGTDSATARVTLTQPLAAVDLTLT
jgi:hypothetical protein